MRVLLNQVGSVQVRRPARRIAGPHPGDQGGDGIGGINVSNRHHHLSRFHLQHVYRWVARLAILGELLQRGGGLGGEAMRIDLVDLGG